MEVDGALLDEARRAASPRTDAETVEEALRLFIRPHGQARILGLAGKVRWQGDLDATRRGRHPG